MYIVKYIYKEEFKKFNVKRIIIGVKLDLKIKQKLPVEKQFRISIDDIIVKYITPYRREISSVSKVGLVFKMKNLSPDLCIEYMPIEKLKAETILERLSKISQSNKEINLEDFELQASVLSL